MKRILLGTTTLIGTVGLFAGAALAQGPQVTLGGFIDFQAGVINDDDDSDQRNHAFRNDTEISVKVNGKTDSGLGYGGEVWLEADVDGDSDNSGFVAHADNDNQGFNASKTFIYLEGNWGRVEGGSNLGPDATMKVDASSIARATGGIDGDWDYFANGFNVPYIASPDLPLNYGLTSGISNDGTGDESQENLSKITYYTPRWSGFQLGVAYIPSDQERGQLTSSATRIENTSAAAFGSANTITVSQADSIWVGGLSYEGTFSQVGINLAATGEAGDAEDTDYEDLRAWNVGGKLSYMGFSLAGSYGDWGDSLRLKSGNFEDNDYWTVGGAYEMGPFGVSVTYLNSNMEVSSTTDNEFTMWSVGADYKLAPGFTPYIEANFFEQDAVTLSNDNDGSVFIAGTQLNF